jgi:hypothetical protein
VQIPFRKRDLHAKDGNVAVILNSRRGSAAV